MRVTFIFCPLTLALFFGCHQDQAPNPSSSSSSSIQDIRSSSPSAQDTTMPKEARDRKARSIAVLKKEHVPFIDHLPVIETEAQAKRRTTDEVAARAMALCIVAIKGEGLEQPKVEKLVKKFGVADAFSPKERTFIDNPEPSKDERAQFSWRYECYWVMLWALGFVDDLARPDKMCDVHKAVSVLIDLGREDFLKKAKLRSATEILDAADLIYRYHWATTQASVDKKDPPAGLNPDVIGERHHALNWLIGYSNQEWDDVRTDT